jgi:hypothetical protein
MAHVKAGDDEIPELLADLVAVGARLSLAVDERRDAVDARIRIVDRLRELGLSWSRIARVAGVTPAALKLSARNREPAT